MRSFLCSFPTASIAEAPDWVCPITFELPTDPVTVEDGRTYERSAIDEHIRTHGASLRSPITNEPMGPWLFPSAQLRNTIGRSGAIAGDKAERWTQRLAEEEEMKEWRAKAEGGNVKAMHNLGVCYDLGLKGLTQDKPTSSAWYKRGAETAEGTEGQIMCLAAMGQAILLEMGVEQNGSHGIAMLAEAAAMGSGLATFELADSHRNGKHGLPKDATRAQKWYARVAHCKFKHLDQGHLELAAICARKRFDALDRSELEVCRI